MIIGLFKGFLKEKNKAKTKQLNYFKDFFLMLALTVIIFKRIFKIYASTLSFYSLKKRRRSFISTVISTK